MAGKYKVEIIGFSVVFFLLVVMNFASAVEFENANGRITCTPEVSGFHWLKNALRLGNEQICEFENKKDVAITDLGFAMAFADELKFLNVELMTTKKVLNVESSYDLVNVSSHSASSEACDIGSGSITRNVSFSTPLNNSKTWLIGCGDSFNNNGNGNYTVFYNSTKTQFTNNKQKNLVFDHRTVGAFAKPEIYFIDGNFPARTVRTVKFNYLCEDIFSRCKWDAILFNSLSNTIYLELDPFGAGLQNYTLDPDDDKLSGTAITGDEGGDGLYIAAPRNLIDNITDQADANTTLFTFAFTGTAADCAGGEYDGNFDTCAGRKSTGYNWSNRGFIGGQSDVDASAGTVTQTMITGDNVAGGDFEGTDSMVYILFTAGGEHHKNGDPGDGVLCDGDLYVSDGSTDVSIINWFGYGKSNGCYYDEGGWDNAAQETHQRQNQLQEWAFWFNNTGDDVRVFRKVWNATDMTKGSPTFDRVNTTWYEWGGSPFDLSGLTGRKSIKIVATGNDPAEGARPGRTNIQIFDYRIFEEGNYTSQNLSSGSGYGSVNVQYDFKDSSYCSVLPRILSNQVDQSDVANNTDITVTPGDFNATIQHIWNFTTNDYLCEVNSLTANFVTVNSAPAFVSITNVSMESNATAGTTVLNASATDADGDTITYTINSTGGLAEITIHNETGIINLSADLVIGDVGNYTVSINASDGTETTQDNFNLEITEAAYTPSMVGVRLDPTVPQDNEDVIGYVNGSDTNGDELTYWCTWTVESSEVSTQKLSGRTEGIEQTLTTFSESNYVDTNTLNLSCIAGDGTLNSSALSVQVTIGDAGSSSASGASPGGGGPPPNNQVTDEGGLDVLIPAAQEVKQPFCPAGDTAPEIPITIFNPHPTSTIYELSIEDLSCEFPATVELQGKSSASFTLQNCGCPANVGETLEGSLLIEDPRDEAAFARIPISFTGSRLGGLSIAMIAFASLLVVSGLIGLGITQYQAANA